MQTAHTFLLYSGMGIQARWDMDTDKAEDGVYPGTETEQLAEGV